MLGNKKKQWDIDNRHIKRLNGKRAKLKNMFTKYGALPKNYPYTKEHEVISDKFKTNQFDELRKILKEFKKEHNIKRTYERIYIRPKNLIEIDYEKRKANNLKRKQNKRIAALIYAGLLPQNISDIKTDQEKEILDLAMNQLNLNVNEIISVFINDANDNAKQNYLYSKLKNKASRLKDKGKVVNLEPKDIILNEYCPFLGYKIDYRTSPKELFVNNSHSFDRIVNSKSYVKGNVWIISRLANTIKNEATDEQLYAFCKNILLQYERKTNK